MAALLNILIGFAAGLCLGLAKVTQIKPHKTILNALGAFLIAMVFVIAYLSKRAL